jgi:hypothetical protein
MLKLFCNSVRLTMPLTAMPEFLKIEKYSLGVGDRFEHQAKAQLRACMMAAEKGVEVIPVWNKSNREHITIGSEPAGTSAAAERAVAELGWEKPFHKDADHIRQDTVDRFIPCSDFFTIDVADCIGKSVSKSELDAFAERHPELSGRIKVEGIEPPIEVNQVDVKQMVGKYFLAVRQAGRIYRHIAAAKGAGKFITEISMDETDNPQTPSELLVILAAIADEGIPIQTIAPKFTGRFNKGVDYTGSLEQFEKDFRADLAVIRFAVKQYSLPPTLKLSVHSGSDKFSIYRPIREAIAKFDAGLHLKTAGTTWLEEMIGLAESGGEYLALAKEIYFQALEHADELCAPYATVIDIDPAKLPSVTTGKGWSAEQFAAALRHDQKNPSYNPCFRQLLHVGYKVAAKMGDRYLDALEDCEAIISKNVTDNLFNRHIKPLFLGV